MLRNYLKVAWRNFVKHKTFSVINVTGLAAGLACFLLIALYVLDELSYDSFFPNAARIYRINSDIRFGGTDLHLPVASDMMGATIKKDYPEVEQYTRIYASSGDKLVKKGNDFIDEEHVAHADSTFFDVFQLPAIHGDLRTALNEPNTVVLTASTAKKYFGTTDAIGKTLETNDNGKTLYKVTAVIHDMPKNAHFQFDFLFSMKNVDYTWGQYLSHNFHTYLLLKKGTDYKAFDKKFDDYIDRYVIPQAQQFMHVNSRAELEKANNKLVYTLIPLTSIHLYSDRNFELSSTGNAQYVYIFSAVALFILLIACINFMNLTTARSANRAREVGIRKVLGTERRKLMIQFLAESTFMVILSLLIGIGIAYASLPLFNNVAGKSMTLTSLLSPRVLPLLILLPFVVGALAGSYPAFFLSGFKPIEVLKGKLRMGTRSGSLRSVLVVFQFCASIFLIIATIVIYRQLNFIRNVDLGFRKDQVLIINGPYALGNNVAAYKEEMLHLPGVSSGTLSSYLPVTSSARSDNTWSTSSVMDTKNGFNMQNWAVDYDYIKTMGMEMVKGRNFSRDFGADSSAIILNETAARLTGFQDPIGKQIYSFNDENKMLPSTIIGVVRDFNFESLHKQIGPLSLYLGSRNGLASFKVKAANVPAILKSAETRWKAMAPGMPFSYRFMDDSFNEMYQSEQRAGTIALTFSVLAILIACLGLFGLATFIAEQRTKEIGIRKVLGANVQGIIRLLSKDFLRLVIISFVIAIPVAWYAMHRWLQDFAFRTSIDWWIFAAAGLIAIFIAVATVSAQSVRAALANPVKSLRTE